MATHGTVLLLQQDRGFSWRSASFRPLSGNHLWRHPRLWRTAEAPRVFVPSRGITCGDLVPGRQAAPRGRPVFVPSRGITCGDTLNLMDKPVHMHRFRPLSGNHLWRRGKMRGTDIMSENSSFRPLSGNHLWRHQDPRIRQPGIDVFSSPLGESPVATAIWPPKATPFDLEFSSPLGESPVAT